MMPAQGDTEPKIFKEVWRNGILESHVEVSKNKNEGLVVESRTTNRKSKKEKAIPLLS